MWGQWSCFLLVDCCGLMATVGDVAGDEPIWKTESGVGR